MSIRTWWKTFATVGGRGPTLAIGLASVVLFSSCESPFNPPVTGKLTVTLATTGVGVDSTGYGIVLDSFPSRPVAINGTVTFSDVTPGPHQIRIGDLANNCAVSDNPRTVVVPAGGVLNVDVTVACASNTGTLAVWVWDAGYGVGQYVLYLDNQSVGYVPGNAGVTIGVPVGHHTIAIGALSCWAAPQQVDVTFGKAVQVTFVVYCGSGELSVKTTTTGGDLDSTGYRVLIDGASAHPIWLNDSTSLGSFPAGGHQVTLSDVAANCSVDSASRAIIIPSGSATRVAFRVKCQSQTRGSLLVMSATTGIEQDGSYSFTLDADTVHYAVADGHPFTIPSLAPGNHSIYISDVASNCSPDSATRHVTVVVDSTATVPFGVSCLSTHGDLQVHVSTRGGDPDPDGYTVVVDGVSMDTIASNGTTTIAGLGVGSRLVALTGIAANCSPDSAARTVAITSSGTTSVSFAVTCQASPRLRAVTQTTGADLDPNGYVLTIGDSAGSRVALHANGDTVIAGLQPGTQTVTLSGVASNCQVTGATSQSVNLVVAETAAVNFQITCVAAPRDIAFNDESRGGISVMGVNGANLLHLVSGGWNPAWSPDGSKIAFIATTCGPAGCHNDIYTMHPDGTAIAQLFISGTGTNPDWIAWKPDGTSLAFSGQYNGTYGLYLVTADGSSVTPVIIGIGGYHPSWSPDGSKIAFTCQIDSGNNDICTVNNDGTGMLRLTNDPGVDEYPAWKPDGSKILYTRMAPAFTGLAAINPDGSGQAGILAYSTATAAAWSPDGQEIVFTAPGGCYGSYSYSYCNPDQILIVNAGGTNLAAINSAGNSPAWRQ